MARALDVLPVSTQNDTSWLSVIVTARCPA
jgi:hypothetical protein